MAPMKCFLLFAIMFLTADTTMGFCNVPQPRLVCAEFFASQVVVEATLLKIRSIHDKDDPEGILAFVYSLRADHLIRGNIDEVFRVYEGNDSGRATFGWKIGRKYLLFLFYASHEKSWALDGCGNSGLLSRAKATLHQIDLIQMVHDSGVIHGEITGIHGETSIQPQRILVEARGAAGTYKATTNAQSQFQMEVPPGHYTVRAVKRGFSFVSADFSYENPHHLRVEPGGCVQVSLVGTSQGRSPTGEN